MSDAVSPYHSETLRSNVLNFREEGCSHFWYGLF